MSILPSTSKLAPELTKSLNKSMPGVGNKAGQSMGSRMASAAGKALKAGAVVGVAAVGAAVGTALVGGFTNAVNRQTSSKVLTGLYGDAKAATSVMGDLRKVAGDSPLNYESYLKAAESLAYAGVEGKSATGTLENVGKAIVAAGGDSTKLDQAMGGVMKAVNNGGVAMMDSLGMISESGVPILSGLAEKFGVPIDQIKKMASAGKINIDDVMSVMQNGTGETFQKMKKAGDAASQSFGNQWKIVKDNVVNAVGDNMIPLLDKLAPMMKPIGDAIVAGIGKLPAIVDGVVAAFKTWAPVLATIVAGLAAYKLVMLGITIGTAAYNAVLAVQKFATAGAAVQMRILNAAMKANPIGLIITAITLLVAGFIVMYKKVGWFRTAVDAAWAGIKFAINAVVTWFKNVLIPWFAAAITNLGAFFRGFGAVIKTVWNGIKSAINAVWQFIKTYVFIPIGDFVTKTIPKAFRLFVAYIKSSMNGWKLVLTTVWNFVKKWVFNPIKKFVTKTIPDAFKLFVDYIRERIDAWKRILQFAWNYVRLKVFLPIRKFVTKTIPDAFKLFVKYVRDRMNNFKNNVRTIWYWVRDHVFKPLNNFIKETVPNAFEKGVDSIKKFWDKLKKIASKPMKFVIDTVYNNGLVKLWNPIAKFIGKDDWKLDKVDVSKFATGGRVSGPGTSTSDSVPARLSNNEHVLSAKDVKNLGGHGSVYGLRAAAAKGWTPGLATGGTLSDAARWLQSKGARITEFGAWGQRVGRHSNGSLHYSGKAFDANYGPGGENATEKSFFDRVIPQMKSLFPKLGYIWRAAGHYNHAHVDTSGGGKVGSGSGGGGGGWIPGLDTLVSGLKDKMKNIGEGRIGSAIPTMTGKLIDGMAEKAQSVFGFGSGGGGGGGASGASQDVVAAVKSVAKGRGWDTGAQWDALDWLINKESSWNPNAANPSSSARGLFQKMTSIHGALEDTVEGQTRWGLNYISGRYNNPVGAMNWHKGHNWYAGGTRNAARGWATVGEQGPELIKLRGGEQIKSNRASQRFVNANQQGERVVMNVNFEGRVDDSNDVVNKLQFEMNRFFAGGRYVK